MHDRISHLPAEDPAPVRYSAGVNVTQYPLEPRDYKPFAQGLLAVEPQRLYIRLWAFETPPEPESRSSVSCGISRSCGSRQVLQALEITLDGKPIEALLRTPLPGKIFRANTGAGWQNSRQICWGNSLQAGSSGKSL